MRNSTLPLFCLALFQPLIGADSVEDGWIDLFDGESLEGWQPSRETGQVEIVDGEIHLNTDVRQKFFLMYDQEFSDFVFEAEVFMPEGKANSGFMFRSNWDKDTGRVFGYQAEVDPSDRAWSGALYDEGRRKYFESPNRDHATSEEEKQASIEAFRERAGDAFQHGEWNRYRIVCEGDSIEIYVNGILTTDITDDMDASGYFGLQHHGEVGKLYRFRNVRVREL